jgi:pimeloyl-ACP methyl ester carboxylesterase
VLRAALGDSFYQLYFQAPGIAEADLERDVRSSIRRMLYGASGDSPSIPDMLAPPGETFLGSAVLPDRLPDWIDPAAIDFYTGEFERTGFTGGLNWYRNIDRNWDLTAPWQDAQIRQPSLFVAGSNDAVITGLIGAKRINELERVLPDLKQKLIIEGAGHWIQQERPDEVNTALIEFIRENTA